MTDKTQILFIPVMACNLRCPCCHFAWHQDGSWSAYGHQNRRNEPALNAWQWLEALERFAPFHLEITGGEPTLYPGLATLVGSLPDGCTWSITSNTLTRAAESLPLGRCTSWTASWHHLHRDVFRSNLHFLQQRGLVPSVSVMARPGHLDDVAAALRDFGPYYRVNILRELAPGVDWAGEHAPAWAELEAMGAAYMANLVQDDIPANMNFASHAACDAGSRAYFCALPDGSVYRCYSDAFLRPKSVLGHVDTWEPLAPASPCGMPCAGCASDHRARKEGPACA